MSNYTIIDRRINPKGKNLSNRQRFLGRAKEWVKNKVRQRAAERDITSDDGESISINSDDISEPIFNYDYNSGDWQRVLPGNKEFVPGDIIKRQDGQGSGGRQAGDGEGEDEFVFSLSKDEYYGILFEDLELPDLVKHSEKAAIAFERKRTGFSTSGTPNNLDIEKSFKNALGRKIALAFPLDRKIKTKREEIKEEQDDEKGRILEEELEKLLQRRLAVTFLDPIDVRYRRYSQNPLPNSQAVVFCLMDVSASMEQIHKEIAKRFFLLLYLFLERKYEKVEIRFVRHTTVASECTEDIFFNGTETGGTLVSTGVKKVNEIIRTDYPIDAWNIYVVQASDGDNSQDDNQNLKVELDELLPKCQYYVYNEVKPTGTITFNFFSDHTNVYGALKEVSEIYNNLNLVVTGSVEDVVPTFRRIFRKKEKNAK